MKVVINDFTLPALEDLIQNSRHLSNLDISWCSLLPKQMKKLLVVISANRKLQYINLAWNNLCDSKHTEKEQNEIVQLIGA